MLTEDLFKIIYIHKQVNQEKDREYMLNIKLRMVCNLVYSRIYRFQSFDTVIRIHVKLLTVVTSHFVTLITATTETHVTIVVSCDKNMAASFRTPRIPYPTGRFTITSLSNKICSKHSICLHFKKSTGSNAIVQ
jgi:hypothetical protein